MLLLSIKRNLKSGFKSLRRRLLRSILTMLGIIFGVGAVVAMLAIGEGASFESQERIKNLGSRNIIIRSVKPPQEDKTRSSGVASAVYGITYRDIERVEGTVAGIERVLPIRETRQEIRQGAYRIDGLVRGTMPWFPEVTGQNVKSGRFLNAVDVRYRAPVCVIGSDVGATLFPYENPIGRTIRVGRNFYRVIGVMASVGGGASDSALVTGPDSAVLIPLTTARERFGKTILKTQAGSIEAETVEIHLLFIKVREIADVLPVSAVIQDLWRRYHPKNDYEMMVPLKLLEEIKRNARMFSLVLGMIAAISLLVGGIGIMNIMLANVTERTREIGIRRALGAKKRDITIQFLSETIVLSVVGGVMGLGFGIALPLAITWITGMKIIFSAWSLMLAFAISALVGLIFGIYPARRAAQLDPIEALRHV
jgi:putative ABC transport system permease protein